MFDGVFTSDPYGDRQRDEPQAAPAPLPWPLIAVSVVFAMLSIVAAVAEVSPPLLSNSRLAAVKTMITLGDMAAGRR